MEFGIDEDGDRRHRCVSTTIPIRRRRLSSHSRFGLFVEHLTSVARTSPSSSTNFSEFLPQYPQLQFRTKQTYEPNGLRFLLHRSRSSTHIQTGWSSGVEMLRKTHVETASRKAATPWTRWSARMNDQRARARSQGQGTKLELSTAKGAGSS